MGLSSVARTAPWDFPAGGDEYSPTGAAAYGLSSNEELTFYQSPAGVGNGLVDEIDFVVHNGVAGGAFDPKLLVRAYYDGEGTPTFEAPLVSLLCLDSVRTDPGDNAYSGGARADVTTNLPIAGWQNKIARTTPPHSDGTNANSRISGTLFLPFRYGGGGMRLTVKGSNVGGTEVWLQPRGRVNIPGSWNGNLRLWAVRSVLQTNQGSLPFIDYPTARINPTTGAVTLTGAGTTGFVNAANPTGHLGAFLLLQFKQWEYEILSIQDATHCIVDTTHIKSGGSDDATRAAYASAGTTDYVLGFANFHKFLARSATERGFLLATLWGAHRNSGAGGTSSFLEGDVRFKMDGAQLPQFESTGTEDHFGFDYYFQAVQQDRYRGCVQRNAGTYPIASDVPIVEDVGAYAIYPNGRAYKAGCVGIWPNLGNNVSSRWTCIGMKAA